MIKRKWYAGAVAAVTFTFFFSLELGMFLGGGLGFGVLIASAFGSAAVAALVSLVFYAVYRWRAALVEYTPSKRFLKVVGIPTAAYAVIFIAIGASIGSNANEAKVAAATAHQQQIEAQARAASAVAEQKRIAALSPEERLELTEKPVIDTANGLVHAASTSDHTYQSRGVGWDDFKKKLATIAKTSPHYGEAQSLLASMVAEDKVTAAQMAKETAEKKRKDVELAKAQEPLEIAARKAYATKLEQQFLEQRMDTTVRATGNKSTNLSIKWVLASRVTAHDLANAGLIDQAKLLGFKSVVFFNGFESELGERWSWDLSK